MADITINNGEAVLLGNNGANFRPVDTDSDGTTDAVRITGCSRVVGNRKLEFYDNVEVQQHLILRTGSGTTPYFRFQSTSSYMVWGDPALNNALKYNPSGPGEFTFSSNNQLTPNVVSANTLCVYGSMYQHRNLTNAVVLSNSYNISSVSRVAANSSDPLCNVFVVSFSKEFSFINLNLNPTWLGFTVNRVTGDIVRTSAIPTSAGIYSFVTNSEGNITGVRIAVSYYKSNTNSTVIYGTSSESSDLVLSLSGNGIIVG